MSVLTLRCIYINYVAVFSTSYPITGIPRLCFVLFFYFFIDQFWATGFHICIKGRVWTTTVWFWKHSLALHKQQRCLLGQSPKKDIPFQMFTLSLPQQVLHSLLSACWMSSVCQINNKEGDTERLTGEAANSVCLFAMGWYIQCVCLDLHNTGQLKVWIKKCNDFMWQKSSFCCQLGAESKAYYRSTKPQFWLFIYVCVCVCLHGFTYTHMFRCSKYLRLFSRM